MDTTEEIRWLFIAMVMKANNYEVARDCYEDIRLRDTLLRIKATESAGLFFILENYEEHVLREADTYQHSHQELGRVLGQYVQFEYRLQVFRRLPHLRQLFQKAKLSRWLKMKSNPDPIQPHVLRYFELLDQATLAGDELSCEDIERCEHLALIFGVPLTSKLHSYREFLDDSGSVRMTSEYEKQ